MIVNERARQIDGYMPIYELNWLAERAKENNLILEVGVYKGRSTRALLDNCNGTVYAVDPLKGPYYNDNYSRTELVLDGSEYDEFIQNTKDCNNLIFYRGKLSDFIKTNNVPKFDMIFIDGDHHYEYVFNDIYQSLKLIKSGGLLCGHDYTQDQWPGVKKAVDECLGSVFVTESIWWCNV